MCSPRVRVHVPAPAPAPQVAVNGKVVLGMQFADVMAALKASAWPRRLAFSRSHAACSAVARAVEQ